MSSSMQDSTISNNNSSTISQPAPTLLTDNYPTAPTILSSTAISSIPSIQLVLRENIPIDISSATITCTTISNGNEVLYYYQEPPSYSTTNSTNTNSQENQQEFEELLLILYDVHKSPIWKLKKRDWHGLTLVYQDLLVVLSTTAPHFRFTLKDKTYHWQVYSQQHTSSYVLKCFQTNTKQLVAELNQDQLSLYHQNHEYNPFRQLTGTDPYITLIILSALLISQHIKNLLKSLGGGPEALQMIVDPNELYHSHPEQEHAEEEEDDLASLSFHKNYPGHQSLVYDAEGGGNRWSSAQSFKSIELDPGMWHCWWGYKFWWSWFPCCMPGGCCDRACIRLRGRQSRVKTTTSRTLSKQGWQQHY